MQTYTPTLQQPGSLKLVIFELPRHFRILYFLLPLGLYFCNPAPLAAQKLGLDKATGKYTYFGVGLIGSQSKDSTYIKTLEWVKFNYKAPKEVIQLADRKNYKIVLSGNFKTNVTKKEAYIGYRINLECREGRLAYTFTDFNYFTLGSGRINFEENNLPTRKKMIKDTQKKIEKLVNSLTSYILLNEKILE
jgi:hypothetical protein